MTPSETTPLISTVQVGSRPPRYRHGILRRFCTIALTSTLVYIFISFIIVLFIDVPEHHGHRDGWPRSRPSDPVSHHQLRELLLRTPSTESAEEWSRYYTSGDHVAGRNYSQVWPVFGVPTVYGCGR